MSPLCSRLKGLLINEDSHFAANIPEVAKFIYSVKIRISIGDTHFAANIHEAAKFFYSVYMYEHRYASPPKTLIKTLYLSPNFHVK
jgi:hypothetical protein